MNAPGKRFTPTPPIKGSFPFDRQGECSELVKAYLECLKQGKGEIERCRDLSKDYLKCRMDNKLMADDKWDNLGFQESDNTPSATTTTTTPATK